MQLMKGRSGIPLGSKRRFDELESADGELGEQSEDCDSELSGDSNESDITGSIEVQEDMLPREPYSFCGALRKSLIDEYGKEKCNLFIDEILAYRRERKEYLENPKTDPCKAGIRVNVPTVFKIKNLIKGCFGESNCANVIAKFSAFVGIDPETLRGWTSLNTNLFFRTPLMYGRTNRGLSLSMTPLRRSVRIGVNASSYHQIMADESEVKGVLNYLCESTSCTHSLDLFVDLIHQIFGEPDRAITARIPIVISFGPRMGTSGFILTEGHQSCSKGWFLVELIDGTHAKRAGDVSTADSLLDKDAAVSGCSLATGRPCPDSHASIPEKSLRLSRERPYNFRLAEPWTMGLGYRESNQVPEWRKRFEEYAEEERDLWPSTIVHCTSCGEMLRRKKHVHKHPQLKVVVCHKCLYVYNQGSFDINPDDGVEEYCRWCGDGGEIMGCDHCPKVFCKTCIHRNFGSEEVEAINSAEDWFCYSCRPERLQCLQNAAVAVMDFLGTNKKNSRRDKFTESNKFYPPVSKNKLKEGIVCEDISNGRENKKIRCLNTFKTKEPPPVFHYVKESTFGEGHLAVNEHPEHLVSCCDCEDDCRDSTKCACAQANDGSFPYNRRRQLLRQRDVIYECNFRCKCHQSRCKNRVVGRGIQVSLEVFKTKLCGWGVRALEDIPAGTFVCEYVGEIISEEEAERRDVRVSPHMGDEYLLSLDTVWCLLVAEAESKSVPSNSTLALHNGSVPSTGKFPSQASASAPGPAGTRQKPVSIKTSAGSGHPSPAKVVQHAPFRRGPLEKAGANTLRRLFKKNIEEIDINDDADMLSIDAKWYGGVARFINHCCEPNLEKQSVFIDTHDARAPRLAFFASGNIKAGDELTWDYGYTKGQVSGKSHPCFCGAENCRGVLY